MGILYVYFCLNSVDSSVSSWTKRWTFLKYRPPFDRTNGKDSRVRLRTNFFKHVFFYKSKEIVRIRKVLFFFFSFSKFLSLGLGWTVSWPRSQSYAVVLPEDSVEMEQLKSRRALFVFCYCRRCRRRPPMCCLVRIYCIITKQTITKGVLFMGVSETPQRTPLITRETWCEKLIHIMAAEWTKTRWLVVAILYLF